MGDWSTMIYSIEPLYVLEASSNSKTEKSFAADDKGYSAGSTIHKDTIKA